MDEHERGLTPQIEGVWPPAPLRDEPPPLSLRLEGMQLTRSGGRLVAVNKSIRRLFLFGVCILLYSSFSPFILFVTLPTHRAILPGLLHYVTSVYLPYYELFMLCVIVVYWILFCCMFNLSGVTLDGRDATVNADGTRARPMSKIKAVHIRMTPHPFLGRRHIIRLLWSGGRPTPDWSFKAALTDRPSNLSYLGSFRHEANADQVATIIAGFVGVPVQRETMIGTRPAPTHPGTRP